MLYQSLLGDFRWKLANFLNRKYADFDVYFSPCSCPNSLIMECVRYLRLPIKEERAYFIVLATLCRYGVIRKTNFCGSDMVKLVGK